MFKMNTTLLRKLQELKELIMKSVTHSETFR